jgi:hypothetical protein
MYHLLLFSSSHRNARRHSIFKVPEIGFLLQIHLQIQGPPAINLPGPRLLAIHMAPSNINIAGMLLFTALLHREKCISSGYHLWDSRREASSAPIVSSYSPLLSKTKAEESLSILLLNKLYQYII